MALLFAAKGRNLALCARRLDLLQSLREELLAINPDIAVLIHALDVNDHPQVFNVLEQCRRQLGSIDRVIVNAGISRGDAIGTGHFADNCNTAQTNFVSALAQCEAALEIFRAQNSGHLVTISSVSAVRGFRAAPSYTASKAALTNLSEAMRIDLLDTPIRVTCVHPGFIYSDMTARHKRAPFMVDTEKGCRAIVKAIEREGKNPYVPHWPWAVLRWVLRLAPARILFYLK